MAGTLAFIATCIVGLVGLTACGGAYLAQPSAATVDLTGSWALDRQVSDDVRARLKRAFDKQDKRWQRAARQFEDGPGELPPDAGSPEHSEPRADGGSTIQWMRSQNRREVDALIAWLSPAQQVDIEQSPRELVLRTNKGEGTRRLEPGGSAAVFLAFGAFQVQSGWRGKSYVVESVGQGDNRIRLLEQYTLLDGGAALEERIQTRLPVLGKHEFRFVYRRARTASRP